jgi:DNA replication protein DnaC
VHERRGRCGVSAATFTPELGVRIGALLTAFKLPTAADELVRRFVDAGLDQALPVLCEVLELESHDRHERRVDRLRRGSRLPPGKTLDTFEEQRLPRPLCVKIREVATGAFVDRGDNVLIFGLPGVGKTHAAAAIGHALVQGGRSVLFMPTYRLVQDLLAARRDLTLSRALRSLDAYDLLILDDIGYVQQTVDEAEVLFTLMAERYERRSLLITSNLVFSHWDRIFKNPMATAAAIDRLVHHSTILEIDVPSFRTEDAKKKSKRADDNMAAGDSHPAATTTPLTTTTTTTTP